MLDSKEEYEDHYTAHLQEEQDRLNNEDGMRRRNIHVHNRAYQGSSNNPNVFGYTYNQSPLRERPNAEDERERRGEDMEHISYNPMLDYLSRMNSRCMLKFWLIKF